MGPTMKQLDNKFREIYSFLCLHNGKVKNFEKAVKLGDAFVDCNNEFMAKYAKYRGDYLKSDSEIAAFAFAMASFDAL